MKKILIVSVIACSIFGKVCAQTSRGTYLFGGGINYELTKTKVDGNEVGNVSALTFGPSVGYFIADGIALGINVSIANEKRRQNNNFDFGTPGMKSTTLSIGPYVRIYKTLSNEDFAFFAQGSINYISRSSKVGFDDNLEKTKFKGLDVAVSPGFTYFFNNRWAVEMLFRGIAYTTVSQDDDDVKDTRLTVGLDSLSPTLGLRITLEH